MGHRRWGRGAFSAGISRAPAIVIRSGVRSDRNRREPAQQRHDPIAMQWGKVLEQRLRNGRSKARRQKTCPGTPPKSAGREDLLPPPPPALQGASIDSERRFEGATARRGDPVSHRGDQDDEDRRVQTPALESSRWRRRAPAAAFASAAEAVAYAPICRQAQATSRLAGVARAVQHVAAVGAASDADLFGEIMINIRKDDSELRIRENALQHGLPCFGFEHLQESLPPRRGVNQPGRFSTSRSIRRWLNGIARRGGVREPDLFGRGSRRGHDK